jgi:hypothetical protein
VDTIQARRASLFGPLRSGASCRPLPPAPLAYPEIGARREPASFVAYGMELWLRFFQVRSRAIYNPRRKRFDVKISGSSKLA